MKKAANKRLRLLWLATCSLWLLAAPMAQAQFPEPEVDPMPVPRNEFGHPSFAGTLERMGNWQGLLGTLAHRGEEPSAFNIEEALFMMKYLSSPGPHSCTLSAGRRAVPMIRTQGASPPAVPVCFIRLMVWNSWTLATR